MSSRGARTSLVDFQPTVLSRAPSDASPLDRQESRLQTVLSRMESHVTPKTPKLGQGHESNIKSIIKVRCMVVTALAAAAYTLLPKSMYIHACKHQVRSPALVS